MIGLAPRRERRETFYTAVEASVVGEAESYGRGLRYAPAEGHEPRCLRPPSIHTSRLLAARS